MRYCSQCGAECADDDTSCPRCGNSELAGSEHHRRGASPEAEDRRTFVRVGSAEDPLTSEHLAAVVRSAHIPVLCRSHLGVMDTITTASGPWWEILVPEEYVEKASGLIERERARMAAAADDAAQAAEEEEAQSEGPANGAGKNS